MACSGTVCQQDLGLRVGTIRGKGLVLCFGAIPLTDRHFSASPPVEDKGKLTQSAIEEMVQAMSIHGRMAVAPRADA